MSRKEYEASFDKCMYIIGRIKQMDKVGTVEVKMKLLLAMHIYPQISLWRVCRENRNAYRDVMGKPEGKIFLGIPRRGWEDNSKIYLKEV
jgi:hypothetical protein